MAALCVVILSIGSIIESLDSSLAMIAGLVVMLVATEYTDRVGVLVFLCSGIVSLFLPLKTPAVFYLVFFGWYPMVQKKIHLLPPLLSRIVKFLVVNFGLALLYLISAFVLSIPFQWNLITALTVVLANVCFVLYDTLLDRFLIWYFVKLRKRLGF